MFILRSGDVSASGLSPNSPLDFRCYRALGENWEASPWPGRGWCGGRKRE